MDNKAQPNYIGQARGKLLRLEKNLHSIQKNIAGGIRSRMIGGIILAVGVLALIGYFLMGSQAVFLIAIAGVIVGGFMLYKAVVRIRDARESLEMVEERVDKAKTEFTDLTAVPAPVE